MAVDSWSSVAECSQSIFATYRRILDPDCPPDQRNEHQRVMESFRADSPYCVQCGLFLAQQEDTLGIHLGLLLVEYFVRFRWTTLTNDEQVQLRNQFLMYRAKIGASEISLPVYIKEGIARVVVELLKKMWPQNWPDFVPEIFAVEEKAIQIELILLIFRRLAEDLLSYDSALSNKRKSDMLASLKEEALLKPLFHLLFTVLQNELSSSLFEVAITTLTSFVDWVDLQFLTFNNCQIVFLLLSLLCTSTDHRLALCDCLTGILSRKGALKTSRPHRELFLKVLSSDIMNELQRCMSAASELSASDEEEYMFLKRLCQMMTQVGVCQLLPLWETSGFSPPEHLEQYLCIMLFFFSHPSQVISLTCLDFWNAVVHHQFFKTHPVYLALLPQLIKLLKDKQLKVGDPTQPLHVSSHYSAIDFDGPEEYNIFFSKHKSLVNRLLTDLVPINPILFQQEAANAVQLLIAKDQKQLVNEGGRNKMSPMFLEWDATTSFLDCWVMGLNQDQSLLQSAASTGVDILQLLLGYNPTDVTSAFCHLKALEGGLQTFVMFKEEELLHGYLEKILTYVIYPGTESDKFALSRDQKQARLNSLHCLINVVKSYAKALQPATQQLLDHFNKLVSSDLLLFSEKCMFIEAFTILSHFKPIHEQAVLLGHLLSEIRTLVESVLKNCVSSLPLFIQYLSFDKDISDVAFCGSETASAHFCRAQLCYCAHTIMGVLQRSTPRVKRQCGATDSELETLGSAAPSFRHIVPLLMNFVLPLIKILHQLWSDSARQFLSPYFQGLQSLHQHDRDTILGISCTSTIEQDELSRIQQQIIMAYDQCVMAVGFAWVNYGPESLSEVGFIEGVLNMVFIHLEETSQLRIKPVIRNLVIPMVISCPPSHWQISLTPLLSRFCSVTFNSLQKNWSSIIHQLAERVDDNEEQGSLSDQVIIHQFTVNLTRQYIQLIDSICLKKDVAVKEADTDAVSSEMLDVAANDSIKDPNKKTEVLSDLALTMLYNDVMQKIILWSVFVPLTWLDGYCVRKCINIATAILEKIPPVEFGGEFICQIMEQLLLGLQTHGEDGGLCVSLITLSLYLYESAAPSYPMLFNLLASLPDSSEEKVQSFNRMLSNKPATVQAKHAKKKKEEFRKLVSGIIGKPIGQLHKLPTVFLDLPSLAVKKDQRLKKAKSPTLYLTSLFEEQ